MWMPIRQIAGSLHDGDHPGPKCLIAHRSDYQLEHRLPRRTGKPPEQLSMVQEVRAQHLGDHEDPLRVATSSSTSSASSAAVAAERLAAQDGHSSRVLHEKASQNRTGQHSAQIEHQDAVERAGTASSHGVTFYQRSMAVLSCRDARTNRRFSRYVVRASRLHMQPLTEQYWKRPDLFSQYSQQGATSLGL
jgi:hypothetical protein